MPGQGLLTWERTAAAILYVWLAVSVVTGYLGYPAFIKKLKDARQEQINVYFVSEVVGKLDPSHEEPVLVILPPGLSADERWFYHYRIRYRLYPHKVDFAEMISAREFRKVSYDYRIYRGQLPVTLHPSNLLPIRTSDYRFIIAIAGAKVDLPGFNVIVNAEDVKGTVFQRIR